MKRVFALCLILALMMAGCSVPLGSELDRNSQRVVPTAQPILNPMATGTSQRMVTLYFQYGNESALSCESREIVVGNADNLETAIVRALIAGPSGTSHQLRGVINPNTELISVAERNGCYYVTLSETFLEPIEGMPENWREDETWRQLVDSNQQLAVYSIVNTLLSLGRAHSVQLMIAEGEDSSARRPSRSELGFYDEASAQPMDPLTLDSSWILTPDSFAKMVFAAVNEANWSRVEQLIAQKVPDRSQGRPEKEELVEELQLTAFSVLDYSLQNPLVDPTGDKAVILADLTLLRAEIGQKVYAQQIPLTFVWENNGWMMSYSSLRQILKEAE